MKTNSTQASMMQTAIKTTTKTIPMNITQIFRTLCDRLTFSSLSDRNESESFSMTHNSPNLTADAKANRARRVLAKVRQRQLEMALSGRILDSARYAVRAQRVRCKSYAPATGLQGGLSACCAA